MALPAAASCICMLARSPDLNGIGMTLGCTLLLLVLLAMGSGARTWPVPVWPALDRYPICMPPEPDPDPDPDLLALEERVLPCGTAPDGNVLELQLVLLVLG